MAGFNFKKLTKDKHKSSKSNTDEQKDQNGITPSKFLHFNINHDNNKQQQDHNQPNLLPKPNQALPPIPQRTPSNENRVLNNNSQQRQQSYNSPQARINPTPQPFSQRNVSGATQLMLVKQQEQQKQQQSQDNQASQVSTELNASTHDNYQHSQHSSPLYGPSSQVPTSVPKNNLSILPPVTQEPIVWNRIKLKNSPFPRYRHVASAYATDDDRIFVIGGLHDQSVYGDIWIIKSLENGTKFESSTVDISESTPPPRVGHAATLCGNAFVVFGGDTHKVNKDGLMDDDLYLFNINSYKWTIPNPIGPRPLGRYGHKISIIAPTPMKTKLYLFGGQFDDTYFNNLAVFDLSSFRRPDSHWEFLKPKTFIPPPLTNHTMVSYDNKLWVFGGDTLQGLINKVFMYDPDINDWCIIDTYGAEEDDENIPPPMQEHAAVMYGHLMCIVGGKDESDNYMNTVYFLNLNTFIWYKLPFLAVGIPQGRSGHSVTLLKNNKLLIMGGDKFDYYRPEEFDLHTSETDMGNGTILYTLDLSRLKDLCPGIMDRVPSDKVPGNDATKLPNKENYPSTPQVSNKEFNNEQKTESPSSLVTANSTIQKDINKLPELAVHNILTPHTVSENQKTPKVDDEETFDSAVENNTPETPTFKENSYFKDENQKQALEKRLTPSSKDHDEHTFEDSDLHEEVTPEIEVAIRTPVKSEHSFQIKESPIKNTNNNNSVDGDNITTEVHKQFTGSSNKLDQLNSTGKLQNNGNKIKHSPLTNFNSTNNKTNSEQLSSGESLLHTEGTKESSLNYSSKDNTTSPSTMIQVDYRILEDLRSELQNLKQLTTDKANEASSHILRLEEENKKLKESLKEHLVKNNQEDDVLEKNKNLCNRIHTLEDLLNEKFLDLEVLNVIIRKQNSTIDKLMSDENFRDKYVSLERKYQLLNAENEELKNRLEHYENEFTENIKLYSNNIEALLERWKSNSNNFSSTSYMVQDDLKPSHEEMSLESPHHKTVVNKLSKQLDDLLVKSKDLSHSRDKLDAEYHKLEKRHRSLSQDLLSQKSLDEAEGEEADNNAASMDKVKTLQLAEKELEKFRKKNKALQDEIEQLKERTSENIS